MVLVIWLRVYEMNASRASFNHYHLKYFQRGSDMVLRGRHHACLALVYVNHLFWRQSLCPSVRPIAELAPRPACTSLLLILLAQPML
jgi:hypothetical protein